MPQGHQKSTQRIGKQVMVMIICVAIVIVAGFLASKLDPDHWFIISAMIAAAVLTGVAWFVRKDAKERQHIIRGVITCLVAAAILAAILGGLYLYSIHQQPVHPTPAPSVSPTVHPHPSVKPSHK
jgi:uncharacterized membrane protein YfcA